mgnify:CR=1 FL=1
MADSVKGKTQETGNKIAETAKKAGHAVSEGAEKAADWVKEKAHQAGHRTEEAAEATGTSSSRNPPRGAPGAPNTTRRPASHGRPTQEPLASTSSMPPSSSGYSAPPLRHGLGDGAPSPPERAVP